MSETASRNGIITGSAFGAAIAFAGAAIAAVLVVTAGAVISGQAAVPATCDTDGVMTMPNDPTLDPGTGQWVTNGITVGAISSTCTSTTNYIRLGAYDTSASTTWTTNDTVITGGNMAINFSPGASVPVSDIDGYAVLIYGG